MKHLASSFKIFPDPLNIALKCSVDLECFLFLFMIPFGTYAFTFCSSPRESIKDILKILNGASPPCTFQRRGMALCSHWRESKNTQSVHSDSKTKQSPSCPFCRNYAGLFFMFFSNISHTQIMLKLAGNFPYWNLFDG